MNCSRGQPALHLHHHLHHHQHPPLLHTLQSIWIYLFDTFFWIGTISIFVLCEVRGELILILLFLSCVLLFTSTPPRILLPHSPSFSMSVRLVMTRKTSLGRWVGGEGFLTSSTTTVCTCNCIALWTSRREEWRFNYVLLWDVKCLTLRFWAIYFWNILEKSIYQYHIIREKRIFKVEMKALARYHVNKIGYCAIS